MVPIEAAAETACDLNSEEVQPAKDACIDEGENRSGGNAGPRQVLYNMYIHLSADIDGEKHLCCHFMGLSFLILRH